MGDPLRVVIVDDERLARYEMKVLLSDHPDVDIVGEAATVEQASRLIADTRPDLIFLDIRLGQRSGFELVYPHAASGIQTRDAQVVFVTGYAEHAVRAFEVNALDYLLKPVRPERLAEAIRRARTGEPRELSSSRPVQLTDVVMLRHRSSFRFVQVADIRYIAAEDDYSCVYTADGTASLVDTALREWERRLPPREFVRIHRSTIVHIPPRPIGLS